MALTIEVKNASGATVEVATLDALIAALSSPGITIASGSQNNNGRAAAAGSAPIVFSTEDKAVIDAIETATEYAAAGISPPFRSFDLDETEEEVKATAGRLHKIRITNFATTPRHVKIYNATAANVTVGTTTPINTITVPEAAASGACVLIENWLGKGLVFSTALSLAATTGAADADTGAPSANDVSVVAYYE